MGQRDKRRRRQQEAKRRRLTRDANAEAKEAAPAKAYVVWSKRLFAAGGFALGSLSLYLLYCPGLNTRQVTERPETDDPLLTVWEITNPSPIFPYGDVEVSCTIHSI